MKTTKIAFLTALLLVVLAGCNNAPPNEDKPQPFSFSESVQSTSETETPAGKESKEVETTPEAVQESEPEKQEETTETDTVSTEQPDKADKTEHSVSTPQPDIPQESETPAPPETEETSSETKTDFDIDYWISFAKGYAQSVGLLLDSEAVYCWDNPIRAGAHCKYLERDIHSRLDRYKADEEITAVWIWAEEVSDGIYDIYIGYA